MTQLGLFSHSEFLLVFWLKIFYRRLLFIIALPFRKSSAEFSLMFIIIRTSTKTKVIIRRLNESACYLSFGFSTINFPSCVTGYVCDSPFPVWTLRLANVLLFNWGQWGLKVKKVFTGISTEFIYSIQFWRTKIFTTAENQNLCFHWVRNQMWNAEGLYLNGYRTVNASLCGLIHRTVK